MEIRISVRNFVEFLLRSGSLDDRGSVGKEDAMQEGSRIHRMIQRRMGADYEPEVYLRHVITYENYTIRIEGRADGIITGQGVTIDEIKGTYRELRKLKEPVSTHLAQTKCYGYIYALQNHLDEIGVRMKKFRETWTRCGASRVY